MMAKLAGMLTGKGRVKYGSEQTSPGRGDINNFTSQGQEVVWSRCAVRQRLTPSIRLIPLRRSYDAFR
jgi:hypothetical protein